MRGNDQLCVWRGISFRSRSKYTCSNVAVVTFSKFNSLWFACQSLGRSGRKLLKSCVTMSSRLLFSCIRTPVIDYAVDTSQQMVQFPKGLVPDFLQCVFWITSRTLVPVADEHCFLGLSCFGQTTTAQNTCPKCPYSVSVRDRKIALSHKESETHK